MNGRWYVAEGDLSRGPLNDEEFAALVRARAIRPETLIWGPGFKQWKAAGEISGLLKPFKSPPPELSTTRHPEISVSTPKLVISTDDRSVVGSSGYITPRRSYLVRHWRGELSLPVSYWINSCLSTIAVFAVFSCVGLLVGPADSPLGFAIVISVAWLFLIVATLWQLVGVWRSAGKHRGRSGKGFWRMQRASWSFSGSLVSPVRLRHRPFHS